MEIHSKRTKKDLRVIAANRICLIASLRRHEDQDMGTSVLGFKVNKLSKF